jgi:hypothetical protein
MHAFFVFVFCFLFFVFLFCFRFGFFCVAFWAHLVTIFVHGCQCIESFTMSLAFVPACLDVGLLTLLDVGLDSGMLIARLQVDIGVVSRLEYGQVHVPVVDVPEAIYHRGRGPRPHETLSQRQDHTARCQRRQRCS